MMSISIFPKNIPAIWLTHKINAGMDYARNSQKWHLLNLFMSSLQKIADYLIMTVNTINSSVILYMPMWKIIIHLVAFSMNQ